MDFCIYSQWKWAQAINDSVECLRATYLLMSPEHYGLIYIFSMVVAPGHKELIFIFPMEVAHHWLSGVSRGHLPFGVPRPFWTYVYIFNGSGPRPLLIQWRVLRPPAIRYPQAYMALGPLWWPRATSIAKKGQRTWNPIVCAPLTLLIMLWLMYWCTKRWGNMGGSHC